MHGSAAFSIFRLLYTLHYHPSLELFSSCKTEPLCSRHINFQSPLPPSTSYFLSLGIWLLLEAHTSRIIHCLSFCDWFISLNIMFISAVACQNFFFKIELHSIVRTYHVSLISSSVAGYLGCFHLMAMVNNSQWTRVCPYSLIQYLYF